MSSITWRLTLRMNPRLKGNTRAMQNASSEVKEQVFSPDALTTGSGGSPSWVTSPFTGVGVALPETAPASTPRWVLAHKLHPTSQPEPKSDRCPSQANSLMGKKATFPRGHGSCFPLRPRQSEWSTELARPSTPTETIKASQQTKKKRVVKVVKHVRLTWEETQTVRTVCSEDVMLWDQERRRVLTGMIKRETFRTQTRRPLVDHFSLISLNVTVSTVSESGVITIFCNFTHLFHYMNRTMSDFLNISLPLPEGCFQPWLSVGLWTKKV